jgi:hypothetical protein
VASRAGPAAWSAPELAEELRMRSGARLFMLRPETLLVHAGRVFDFEVSAESLSEVKRVDEQLATPDRKQESDSGWTSDTLQVLLERLDSEGWVVQAHDPHLTAELSHSRERLKRQGSNECGR